MSHGFDWPEEIGPQHPPTSERERLALIEERMRWQAQRLNQQGDGMGRAFGRLDRIEWRLHPLEMALAQLRDLPMQFRAHQEAEDRRREDAEAAEKRQREAEEARRELRRDALTLAKYVVILAAMVLTAVKAIPPEVAKTLAPVLGLGK